jgi:hypothetical protein
MANYI